ncbi:MAG: hypothetical protein KC492_20840 [Myxococcales bacterium]|nr:hypothetical protein [Myxococcales bacterium]
MATIRAQQTDTLRLCPQWIDGVSHRLVRGREVSSLMSGTVNYLAAVCVLMCAALVGCSSDPPGGESSDAGEDVQADVVALGPMELRAAAFIDEGLPLVLLQDGDVVDLSAAIQGGHVMYVAAQVKNLQSTTAELQAQLHFPDNGAILAREARTVAMRPIDGEEGWWQPDIRSRSQVDHIPACPNYEKSRSVRDEVWRLDITVIRLEDNEQATTSLNVIPKCRFQDPTLQARCECECRAGYELGDTCQ